MLSPSYKITSYSQHIPGRRTLHHFPIFDTGKIVDSAGKADTYTVKDLQSLVKAFDVSIPEDVPIVLGHVSEDMVKKVAKALDIEPIILQGEGPTNKGAARLGEITGMYVEETDKLSGDLAFHPKVARLVDEGFFTSLSVEISPTGRKDYPKMVSRVALLGAQRPAVKTLGENLQDRDLDFQEFTMRSDFQEWAPTNGYHDRFLTRFFEDEDIEGSAKAPYNMAWDGSTNAPIWEVPMKITAGGRIDATVSAADHISAKSIALRSVENFLLSATGPLGKLIGGAIGTIIGGKLLLGKPILKMRGRKSQVGNMFYKMSAKNLTKSKRIPQAGNQKRWLKVLPRMFSEGDEVVLQLPSLAAESTDNTNLHATILTMQEHIESLEYQVLVQEYQEQVMGMEYIPGTSRDLGERLAVIHRNYSEEDATDLLRVMRTNNEKTFQDGVCELMLMPGDSIPKPTDFNRHYEEFREEHPELTAGEAYRQSRKSFYSNGDSQ